jgi:hypothetical protein
VQLDFGSAGRSYEVRIFAARGRENESTGAVLSIAPVPLVLFQMMLAQ